MERLKIGIIGAGPAGLTLALALAKRNNVEFIVLEKSDKFIVVLFQTLVVTIMLFYLTNALF